MKKIALLAVAILCFGAVNAAATPREIRELRSEIEAIRAQMAAQQAQREALAARRTDRLNLSFDFLTVFQGTHNESRNVGNYRLDILAERNLGQHGRAFARLRVGEGDGLAPFRNTLINLNATAFDGDANIALNEIWYEHTFCKDNKFAVTFGKINPTLHSFDANAVANSEAGQFMNAAFVNNAAIAFTEPNLGLMVAVTPTDMVEFSAGYFVGDDNDNFQVDRRLFGIAQINFRPFENGNYRFMVWSNTSEGITGAQQGYGWAISADQKIMDNVTLFARYGWAQPEYFLAESALSGGVSVSGNLWGRANDTAAFAIGRVWGSSDVLPAIISPRDETHAELFYSLSVTNALTLTPSLQYVRSPLMPTRDDMFVYGVRARVQF